MGKQMIPIYTDGACSKNPGPGGYGVICIPYGYAAGERCNKTTNNREELKALIHAIEFARKCHEKHKDYFIIYSDSKYCVNICNDWIFKWAGWNWQRQGRQKIENLDLIKQLYEYLSVDFPCFQVCWCKGHSGIPENELADSIASNNIEKWHNIINQQHYEFWDGYIE